MQGSRTTQDQHGPQKDTRNLTALQSAHIEHRVLDAGPNAKAYAVPDHYMLTATTICTGAVEKKNRQHKLGLLKEKVSPQKAWI